MEDEIILIAGATMSNKELAKWFELTETTFTRYKKEKLKELAYYCKFEIVKRKVHIIEVYHSIYVKKKSEAYKIALNNLDGYWSETNLDTVSGRIYNDFQPKKSNGELMKDSSFYHYSLEARTTLYGKPNGEPGELGFCCAEWACRDDETGAVRALNQEEKKMFSQLVKAYFGTDAEKVAVVEEQIQNNMLPVTQGWTYFRQLTNSDNKFKALLKDMADRGIRLVKGTRRVRDGFKTDQRLEKLARQEWSESVK